MFVNNLIAEYHYFQRDLVLRSMPRVSFIETTNHCNLDCVMCPRSDMKREIGFINVDTFKKIITQIKNYSHFVWLHLFGEPLFHRHIGDFINYCRTNGVRPGISTNGTILDTQKSEMLLESGLDTIYLCLDGFSKESYEKIRKGSDYDGVKNNIETFLELKRKLKKKTKSFVTFVKLNENVKEIESYKKYWRNQGAEVLIKDFCAWGNQIQSIANTGTPFDRKTKMRFPCMYLWKDGGFLWNGDFVICCMDFNGCSTAGNIAQETIKEIWNSDSMVNLRRDHKENAFKHPLCKNCTEWPGMKRNMLYPFSRLWSKAAKGSY